MQQVFLAHQLEQAEYISALLEDMRKLAIGANLAFLAYLIAIAGEEARQIKETRAFRVTSF